MNGNEGVIGLGSAEDGLLSQRFGGAFLTRAAMLALAPQKRAHGMVVLSFEDQALFFFNAEGASGGLAPDEGDGVWMSVTPVLGSKSWTFAAAALGDVDGIVETPIATVATPSTVDCTDDEVADGAHPTAPGYSTATGFAAWPTVTSDASTGAFALSEFVFTGTYRGQTVTRSATLTDADGGETIIADGPLETISSIAVPAMADTDGALTYGWSGIGPGSDALGNLRRWYVVSNAAAANADTANLHVGYGSPDDETTDTVLLAKGASLNAYPYRIFEDSTAPMTIYEL